MYEATNADDAIKLERLNLLVVGAEQGFVQFMEMGSLLNSGDRTFVTANPQDQALAHAIKFALPNGALGVQMQSASATKTSRPGRRHPGHQPRSTRQPPVRAVFFSSCTTAQAPTSRCRCRTPPTYSVFA